MLFFSTGSNHWLWFLLVAIFTGILYFGSKWGIKKIMNETGVDDEAVGILDKTYRVIGVLIILIGIFFGSYMVLFHEVRVNESLNPEMTESAGKQYKKKLFNIETTTPEEIERKNQEELVREENRIEKKRIEEEKASSDEYEEFLKKSLEGVTNQETSQ